MAADAKRPKQSNQISLPARLFRWALAALVAAAMAAIVLKLADSVSGSTVQLRISGGSLLGGRHLLARALQAEAGPAGIGLQVVPTAGSLVALDMLNEGSLDFALVAGGLPANYENVVHVATINPVPFHLIVRPEIRQLADLKGRTINFEPAALGQAAAATPILQFAGLQNGIDYQEVNLGYEALIALKPERLPDATIDVNYAPSAVADYLIKQQGYTLLELPFAEALALRYPWVGVGPGAGRIQAFAYGAAPAGDLATIGVSAHLLANRRVEPKTVFAVLDTLYSAGVASRMRMRFDPVFASLPSGFPLSEGTRQFLARNEPLLSPAMVEKLEVAGKLLLTLVIGGLLLRWLLDTRRRFDDGEFRGYITEVADVEQEFMELEATGGASAESVRTLSQRLSAIKLKALESLPKASFENKGNVSELLIAIADARTTIAGDTSGVRANEDGGILGRLRGAVRRTY